MKRCSLPEELTQMKERVALAVATYRTALTSPATLTERGRVGDIGISGAPGSRAVRNAATNSEPSIAVNLVLLEVDT